MLQFSAAAANGERPILSRRESSAAAGKFGGNNYGKAHNGGGGGGGARETAKVLAAAAKKAGPPKRANRFPLGAGRANRGGEPRYYGYLPIRIPLSLRPMKKIILSPGNGLTVKNGRLINEGFNGMTGIQAAANARKLMKREQKVSMMEEAMYRAEMRADMNEKEMD